MEPGQEVDSEEELMAMVEPVSVEEAEIEVAVRELAMEEATSVKAQAEEEQMKSKEDIKQVLAMKRLQV